MCLQLRCVNNGSTDAHWWFKKEKSNMACKQTTSYEDCNQSTNSTKMKGENMRAGGCRGEISPHVVDRLYKKRKVADRIDGGWIERVDGGGEGGWMQCMIRGREGLH